MQAVADDVAEQAAADIRSGYPARARALADGVAVEDLPGASRLTAGARITNRHPLAHLFELGTRARHTAIGANRGSMPASHVFQPIAERYGRQFWREVPGALAAEGITVRGSNA